MLLLVLLRLLLLRRGVIDRDRDVAIITIQAVVLCICLWKDNQLLVFEPF